MELIDKNVFGDSLHFLVSPRKLNIYFDATYVFPTVILCFHETVQPGRLNHVHGTPSKYVRSEQRSEAAFRGQSHA